MIPAGLLYATLTHPPSDHKAGLREGHLRLRVPRGVLRAGAQYLRYNGTGRRTHSLLYLRGVARLSPSAGETPGKAVPAKLR